MKTIKRYAIVLVIVICVLLLTMLITETAYNITPFEYWQDSASINMWEKSYLTDKGKIYYGMSNDSNPLAYADKNNECSGIMVDYVSLLSIEIGVPIELKPIETKDKPVELKKNSIDTTDIVASQENKKKFIETQEIFRLKGAVLKRQNDASILRVRNLRRKTVAVFSDQYAEEALKEKFKEEEMSIVKVDSISEAMDLIENGDIDAVVGDKIEMQAYLNSTSLKHKYSMLDDEIYDKKICLFLDKDDIILKGILNKAILRIKKKNLLPQIADKWVGSSGMEVNDWNNYRYLPGLVLIILILGVWIALSDRLLRHRINLATEEIQNQKDSLRTVIDSVVLSFFVLNGEDEVTECNEEAMNLTKCDYEEMIGRKICEIQVINRIYDLYQKTKRNIVKIDDKIYNIYTRNMSEHMNSRLLICEDITEKTMVQRELNQKNKMEAVGQLSAGLAHEIRNPLGLIENYRYIIDEYADDEVSKHAVDVIDKSVQRINMLIENLLNYSKPGNDRVVKINVQDVVENLLVLEKKKAAKSGINFEIEVEENLNILTNEEIFKIVISNLVKNGIEAFDKIESDNKKLSLRIYRNEEGFAVEVEDNGPGINQQKAESIFNPFFTSKDNGTGLGLYIVSTELEKMGGSISVKSEEGKGAVFTATFPIMREREDDEESM